MTRLPQTAAALVLAVCSAGGAALAADENLRGKSTAEVTMADEAAVQDAEAAVKAAEEELQAYLGGTVTRGIVLDENRGKKLRDLRQNVDAAKKRLDEAKSQ